MWRSANKGMSADLGTIPLLWFLPVQRHFGYCLRSCAGRARFPSTTIMRSLASIVLLAASLSTPALAQTPATEAVCSSDSLWMNNDKSQSPCLVAAYLQGACVTGYYFVGRLAPDRLYTQPGGRLADGNPLGLDLCTCSDAVYNLMSACAACQNGAWWNWEGWISKCTNDLRSSTSYPANITIPSGTSIPFWATVDPSTWPDRKFNVESARTIDAEGHPDITRITGPSSTPVGGSKSNVGPIVGGVVGGVVAIIGLISALLLFLRYRRKNTALPQNVMVFPVDQPAFPPSAKQGRRPPLVSLGSSSSSYRYHHPNSASLEQALVMHSPPPVPMTQFQEPREEVHAINPFVLSDPASSTPPEKRTRYNPPAYSTPSPEDQSVYDPPPTWAASTSGQGTSTLGAIRSDTQSPSLTLDNATTSEGWNPDRKI